MMIFLAKKSKLVGALFLSVSFFCLVLIGMIVNSVLINQSKGLIVVAVFLLVLMIVLGWLWFGTVYRLDGTLLFYQSGPINGQINVHEISAITKNETMVSGLKPALAGAGLIIKYGKWDEIYIAPIASDQMISALLDINPNIKLQDKNID